MTNAEYVAKMRHEIDVIERLGVIPHGAVSGQHLLRVEDFHRVFAGQPVEHYIEGLCEFWDITYEGVKFCCNKTVRNNNKEIVTLGAQ